MKNHALWVQSVKQIMPCGYIAADLAQSSLFISTFGGNIDMIAQKKIIASIAAVVLTAAAFWYVNGNYRSSEDENKTKETQRTYTQITAHKAKEIMDTENDYIILDVRTQEEYSSGHMKDAVCLPNEEIVNEPDILPDKAQKILVYCRSGNRSRQAAQKLADLGYKNVLEFGGIMDWPYADCIE